MAFRTNKVPAIEERSVSGSSVSFNSAFALPLKACKVSFSATQAGSGDPSPSNPRAISGVSAIGLTANSTPVSVSLGDTRYGGELDVVRKKLVLTRGYDEFDGSIDENWEMLLSGTNYGIFRLKIADLKTITSEINQISNIYSLAHVLSTNGVVGFRIYSSDALDGDYLVVRPNNVIDMVLSDFIQLLTNTPMQVVYEYVTPIEIDLSSIPDLSSIVGNNTFSTDTGTLEITFADLQEKSASGSVATFNTALAMPLASCKIAVNAWQEGSGDPSPVNERPIHGFSEVNATRAGKNIFSPEKAVADSSGVTYSDGWLNFRTDGSSRLYYRNVNLGQCAFTAIVKSASSSMNGVILTAFYTDGTSSSVIDITTADTDEHIVTGVSTSGKTISYLRTGFTNAINTSIKIQMSVGSTATPYEPYTGNIYTVQLGQEVYGAEVDVDNGVAHVTHNYATTYNRNLNITQYDFQNRHGVAINQMLPTSVARASGICNMSVVNNSNLWIGVNNVTVYWIGILDDLNMTLEEFKEWIVDHPLEVAYLMRSEHQFDIQLTPTQIETIIGNNTIFADTGDVDLTFKDLDIAKRGNFREVFKLPS